MNVEVKTFNESKMYIDSQADICNSKFFEVLCIMLYRMEIVNSNIDEIQQSSSACKKIRIRF